MAKGFHAKQQLKKDNTNWPNINFRCYLGVVLVETFRSLVPVSTNTLGCKFNFILALVKCFAKAKISYLDFTIVEYYILGF